MTYRVRSELNPDIILVGVVALSGQGISLIELRVLYKGTVDITIGVAPDNLVIFEEEFKLGVLKGTAEAA